MKNALLLTIMVWGLYSCTQPKYIAEKQSIIATLDLDRSTTNYIPLDDNHINQSKILDSTYYLIQRKKYSKLDKYIRDLAMSGNNSSELYLSKTLYYISKKYYANATNNLGLVSDSTFTFLKCLLTIDLSYEMAIRENRFNYNEFLKSYQDLIDSFPNHPSLKKIVAIRLRYLRYKD